jgi:REP element-mobilizing transposase RayT
MQDVKSLTYSVWECKYHVVWIPKYRRKKLYGELREYLGLSAFNMEDNGALAYPAFIS